MGSCGSIKTNVCACFPKESIIVSNQVIEISDKDLISTEFNTSQKDFEVLPLTKYSLSQQNIYYRKLKRNQSTAIKENIDDDILDPTFHVNYSLSDEQLALIKRIVQENDILPGVTNETLDEFALGFNSIEVNANLVIYSETEQSLLFYIIEKGTVELEKDDEVVIITTGQYFGRECFEGNNFRIENAKAKENTLLLCCSRDFYIQAINYDRINQLQKRIDLLRTFPLFKYADNTDLMKIAQEMQVTSYHGTSILINEREPQKRLCIIQSGIIRSTRNCKLIHQLKAGDYFCTIGLFLQTNSAYTYSVETDNAILYEIPYDLIDKKNITDMIYQLFMNSIKKSERLSEIFIKDYKYFFKIFQLKYYEKNQIVFPLQAKNNKKLCLIIIGELRYRNKETIIAKAEDIYGDTIIDSRSNLDNDIMSYEECIILEASWDKIVKSSENDKSNNNDLCETVKKLKRVALLSELTETQFLEFAQKVKKHSFVDGEIIFKEGQVSSRYYIIKSGKVKLYQKKEFIREIDQYGCFGEIPSITGEIQLFTVIAEGNTDCYSIQSDDILRYKNASLVQKIRKLSSLKDTQITLNDLYFIKQLGHGRFGKVFLVHNQKDFYAVKYVKISNIIKNRKLLSYFTTEKTIMLQIDHPFILKLVKTLKNKDYLFFLLEYIDGITLRTYIDKRKKQDSKNSFITAFYSGILLIVINYLHTKKILHRDIKPDNCMIEKNGYLKLIDFGIAKELFNKDKTFTQCGTPHYLAPEVIMGKGYSYSSDYWSLGVTIYELFYGYVPFGQGSKDGMEVYNEIINSKLKVPYEPQLGDLHSLFKIMLSKNIMHRVCNYPMLKAHRFFAILSEFDQLLSFSIRPPFIPDSYIESNANNNSSFLSQCNVSMYQYISSRSIKDNDHNKCESPRSDYEKAMKCIEEF